MSNHRLSLMPRGSQCPTRAVQFPLLVLLVSVAAAVSLQTAIGQVTDDPSQGQVDFATDITPILEEKCLGCHAPGIAKGSFSLATAKDLIDNEFIEAGAADESYFFELITSQDGQPPEMPQDGEPLSPQEVDLLKAWIDQGAIWPDEIVLREKPKADGTWWSLQPLPFDDPEFEGDVSIDQLIKVKLEEQGLALNPPADRRTLIRRATFDLLGLPPTPEEVAAFVGDDDPKAYERLIDRLLNSPHYGERWGRHWLDVVRFGESNGFERNVLLNELWPFRDYVIRSINEDKPLDKFIREHLAGDILGQDQPDVAVGTAFLVAGPYDDVGNQDAAQQAQIRANTLDEIIRATSESFLGLTVGCARCHDHKFDPITQEDYYSLYASFSGVRHGSVILASEADRAEHDRLLKPLEARKSELSSSIQELEASVLERAKSQESTLDEQWPRDAVQRTGTTETIQPVNARYVRFICDGTDVRPAGRTFKLDEFEIWTTGPEPANVALSSAGTVASGKARINEDFPGVYGPHLAIDGKTGERFISASDRIMFELPAVTEIERFVFSSARGEENPEHDIFGAFPAEYRIEISLDKQQWSEVAHGRDRQPVNSKHREHRILAQEMTSEERQRRNEWRRELQEFERQIARINPLPRVWIGTRNETDAEGPFHVFVGGSPQRLGNAVSPASLRVLGKSIDGYELATETAESERRLALANWLTRPEHPLTARVLANRVWHYHFGTGLVDTPSDFGYMGSRPSHPRLLDFLALQLIEGGYRLKPLHRQIMLSETYRQASTFKDEAAAIDADARLLWRFPPRRLSAEEIRDTLLQVSGKLDRAEPDATELTDGGPGFRLYRYMQDNVATYAPLDHHGPETYRRAVYHQNARASVVDLMTDFDQPDCTFSAPRRAATTTPLQALTMLNHSFTIDMAEAFSSRLRDERGTDAPAQISLAYQLCFSREPTADEMEQCEAFVSQYDMASLCRVLLNTSELIYLGLETTPQ